MLMELARINLREALAQPGCPACRLRECWESEYLQMLLADYVTDGTTRLALVRSMGLCPRHAWDLQAAAQQQWRDGLKVAILYESVGLNVYRILSAYLAKQGEDDLGMNQPRRSYLRDWLVRRGRLGRALAARLFPPRVAGELLEHLAPRQECPMCEMAERREQLLLRSMLSDSQCLARLAASDGFCLPHLRRALAYAPNEGAAHRLVAVASGQLRELLAHLREYQDKHRWQDRPELRKPWEEASWIRMVAYLAGETWGEEDMELHQARQRAGENYRRRPARGSPVADDNSTEGPHDGLQGCDSAERPERE